MQITRWLIGPARRDLKVEDILTGLVERLAAGGVRLTRARVGQRVANPLIGACGVLWTADSGETEFFTVPRSVLSSPTYHGSPFEYVVRNRRSFRRCLQQLDPAADHPVLFELAETGATGYVAIPLEYGDGSVQGGAFMTDRPGGFREEQAALIEALAPAIAAAMEPFAMRYSMQSLLEVYLGAGPASQVVHGSFLRGQTTEMEAAVLVTDLRDFTGLSERLPPDALLEQLGRYFEAVVESVRAEGGDVLKFIGDGVLSVFSADGIGRREACIKAGRSIGRAFRHPVASEMRFVAALHVGRVVYGNIGSPDRLDFTVVGPTVNYVSRLEFMAKALDRQAVCSADVAEMLPARFVTDMGLHVLKGISSPQRIFAMSDRTAPAPEPQPAPERLLSEA